MFFLSAIAGGLAMMIVESRLSSRALGRGLEMPLLMSLGRALVVALGVYGAVRLVDMARRGVLGEIFTGSREAAFFQLEFAIGVILPMALLAFPAVRRNSGRLYGAALLVVAGFVVNRLNVSITGLEGAQGGHYVPDRRRGDHHADAGRDRHRRLRPRRPLPARHGRGRGAGARGLGRGGARRRPGPRAREELKTPLPAATSVARRLRPWRRLAVRMGLGLGLGAAAILWLADQLSLDRQRAQLEGLVGLSADRVAETIHRATHDGMLRNDADGVRRIIENIGAQEGVDRVRIYNKEGRVRVSSAPAEEGTLVDKRSDECIACHAGAQPKAGLERERPDPDARGPRPGAHPRHHHPHLQRAQVHVLPRAPRLAARARASSTCGSRWPRPTRLFAPPSGRCSTGSSPPASRCSC